MQSPTPSITGGAWPLTINTWVGRGAESDIARGEISLRGDGSGRFLGRENQETSLDALSARNGTGKGRGRIAGRPNSMARTINSAAIGMPRLSESMTRS